VLCGLYNDLVTPIDIEREESIDYAIHLGYCPISLLSEQGYAQMCWGVGLLVSY
jgi:hypothetical protein